MTRPFEQVSILDYPQVTANARYEVSNVTADSLARSINRIAERTFDDLDYFDIFAVKCGETVLGFRTYFRASGLGVGALVSVWPREAKGVLEIIAAITQVAPSDIAIMQEPM